AVNMDAARYCAAPIFREEDVPGGVGLIKNVVIRNMTAHKTRADDTPAMALETNMRSFTIENFVRERSAEPANNAPTARLRNMCATQLRSQAQTSDISVLGSREQTLLTDDAYELLAFNTIG
ncbi:MAG: hypothetical protein WCQ72_03665, partial [Eubacteriales bacterium]